MKPFLSANTAVRVSFPQLTDSGNWNCNGTLFKNYSVGYSAALIGVQLVAHASIAADAVKHRRGLQPEQALLIAYQCTRQVQHLPDRYPLMSASLTTVSAFRESGKDKITSLDTSSYSIILKSAGTTSLGSNQSIWFPNCPCSSWKEG